MLDRIKLPPFNRRARASRAASERVRPAPALTATRGSRILRNLAIGLAVALVVFTVAGFFIVPPVAKHYLVKMHL